MKITQYLKIGRCLKIFRIKAGITQKEMAGRLKLSVPTYSNYENGYSSPTVEVLQEFCTAAGIYLNDFLRYAVDNAEEGG